MSYESRNARTIEILTDLDEIFDAIEEHLIADELAPNLKGSAEFPTLSDWLGLCDNIYDELVFYTDLADDWSF